MGLRQEDLDVGLSIEADMVVYRLPWKHLSAHAWDGVQVEQAMNVGKSGRRIYSSPFARV